jgi:hypothetical protein
VIAYHFIAGYDVTMEDLMTNTSMTYGETYVTELKGSQLKETLEGIAESGAKHQKSNQIKSNRFTDSDYKFDIFKFFLILSIYL